MVLAFGLGAGNATFMGQENKDNVFSALPDGGTRREDETRERQGGWTVDPRYMQLISP